MSIIDLHAILLPKRAEVRGLKQGLIPTNQSAETTANATHMKGNLYIINAGDRCQQIDLRLIALLKPQQMPPV